METPQRATAIATISRAKALGIPYDRQVLLSLECPAVCPILGTPIAFERGKGQRPSENVASFDQIVPRAGYVAGNVRIISRLANTMLNSATREQRIALARWILRNETD
jgi:hypothetical protein